MHRPDQRRVALLLTLGSVLLAAAAPTALPVFTLDRALVYARAHQPSLRAALARVRSLQAEAQLPRAARYPRLGAGAELLFGTANNSTASYATLPALDVVRLGGTAANAPLKLGPEPSTLLGLGVRQELFDFGRLAAQATAADLLAAAEGERAEGQRADLELLVEESFLGVQAAKSLVRASEGALARARAHRELAMAGVGSGLRPPIELTRSEAEVARAEVGGLRAFGGLAVARTLLAGALGADDPLVDAADEPPRRRPELPLAEALARVEEREPLVREARTRLRAQQGRTGAIAAELLPDLSLSAGLNARAGGAAPSSGTAPTGAGLLPVIPNWDAVALLSWPLFDQTVRAREAVSRAQEESRAAEVDVARERARSAVEQAFTAVGVAREALPAIERSRDAARKNQAQAEARFKAGLGTVIETADAEALLTDAEIQLAIGEYQLARARALLARASPEAP